MGKQGKILIVVHGPGRGRNVPTGEVFMARLREADPAFAHRFRFHPTGTGKPDLSGVDLVVFWLGDPLNEKYPDCFAEAVAVADAARQRGIPLINSPESLCLTSKTRQSAVWQQAGVPSARAKLVYRPEELVGTCQELGGACIVRSNVEHAQRDVLIVRNAADARRVAQKCAFPAAVIQLFDIRAEHRAAGVDRSSLFSRYHHKARAFVFGDAVMRSHLFFAPDTVVGLSNCLLKRESGPRHSMLRALGFRRDLLKELIRADMDYFEREPLYAQTLVEAVRALGLDVAVVDYSLRPDGSVILWEANPYFCLPRGEESVLSSERNAVERVNASLDWMANQLRARVEYAHELSA